MGRWEPDARGRLMHAALELYVARGFEQTTVAEIAKEAGLTERTFFRYFADKREVLFWGATSLQELLLTTIAEAPAGDSPMAIITLAIEAAGGVFQSRRDGVLLRHSVIAANPELQERELIKLSLLASAMAEALRERGVSDPSASLSAEAGIAVLKVAFDQWVNDPDPGDLPALMRELFNELTAMTGAA